MQAAALVEFVLNNADDSIFKDWTPLGLALSLGEAAEERALGYINGQNGIVAVAWGKPFKNQRTFHVTGVVIDQMHRRNSKVFTQLFFMLRQAYPGYKLEYNRRYKLIALDKKQTNKLKRKLSYG